MKLLLWSGKNSPICEIPPFGYCGRNLAGYLMRYTLGHDLWLQSWMTSNNTEMWFMSQAMMRRFWTARQSCICSGDTIPELHDLADKYFPDHQHQFMVIKCRVFALFWKPHTDRHLYMYFWTELASCVHSSSGVDSSVDVFQMSGRALNLGTSQRLSLTQTRLSCLTYINLPVTFVINFFI